MAFTYLACHPLGRQLLAPALRLINPEWTEVANGVGSFTATIALTEMQASRDQLRSALEPDESAIYVQSSDFTIPFGGVIVEQKWDPAAGTVAITAVDWKSWLYNIFLGPKLDLTGDNIYAWTNQDQLLIAREIVGYAIASGIADGRPLITIGSEVSGKLRDLSAKGLDFKTAGELLDTMSQRSGGFEWDLRPYVDGADGLPRLRLVFGYPELGSFLTGVLFKSTPDHANMTIDGTVDRSSAARRTRVWTSGSAETLPFAVDSDPGISTGTTLLRETVTSYNSVTERTTLAEHALAERQFLNPKLNNLSVLVSDTLIPASSFFVGDRARLILRDDWYDMDLPATRIVSRTLTPESGAGQIKISFDLTDFEMPDVDEGVTVA